MLMIDKGQLFAPHAKYRNVAHREAFFLRRKVRSGRGPPKRLNASSAIDAVALSWRPKRRLASCFQWRPPRTLQRGAREAEFTCHDYFHLRATNALRSCLR